MKNLIYFISIFIVLTGCKSNNPEYATLVDEAEVLIQVHPDRAHVLLDKVLSPDELDSRTLPEDTCAKKDAISSNLLIKVLILPSVLSSNKKNVSIKIVNYLNIPISFGSEIMFEYYNQESSLWENVMPKDYAYNLLNYEILPSDSCTMQVYLYGNNTPGRYRLTKKFYRSIAPQGVPYIVSTQFVLSAEGAVKQYL